MKLRSIILFSTILLTFGCSVGKFIPNDISTEFSERTPCNVKFVKALEAAHDDYFFIGICKAISTGGSLSSSIENHALAKLKQCACENGGDIVRISKYRTNGSRANLASLNNSLNDEINGEVYRMK